MISVLSLSNYRSILDLKMPLSQLNVITGPNGSGKSKAMLNGETAIQGGLRSKAMRMKLGFATHELSYAITLGLPKPSQSALVTFLGETDFACI